MKNLIAWLLILMIFSILVFGIIFFIWSGINEFSDALAYSIMVWISAAILIIMPLYITIPILFKKHKIWWMKELKPD